MKILALTTFKHEIHTFEAGNVYEVSDRFGHYFENHGWAAEDHTDAKAIAVDFSGPSVNPHINEKAAQVAQVEEITLEVDDVESVTAADLTE